MANILVTRPAGKTQPLAQALEQQGHKVTVCSVLNLTYLPLDSQQLSPLSEADKVIFISQDAVWALKESNPTLPKSASYFAVGDSTALALQEAFSRKAKVPKSHDSEGLLELPPLKQVEQQNIVLVKGESGRPLLAKTLKERGAFLNPLVVYRRDSASENSDKNADHWLSQWQTDGIDTIVVTSNSAVDAIFNSQNKQHLAWLKGLSYCVASPRIASHLQQQGVDTQKITTATGASTSAISACFPSQQGSKMSDKPKATSQPKSSQTDRSTSSQSKGNPMNDKPIKQPSRISKLAVLALLIALIAVAGSAYLVWQDYQQKSSSQNQAQQLFASLQQENQALNEQLQQLVQQQQAQKQMISQQRQAFSEQLSANEQAVSEQISQALAQAKRAEQEPLKRDEVNRLAQMAEFKLWAEQDYQGAAAVLKRLDAHLAQYAGTASIRQAIHSDLQALAGVELANTQTLVLTLHGLTNQVGKLPFNMVELPEEAQQSDENALSDNIDDWQSNLSRSWRQLVDDFIKVRKREAPVEPLLDSKQQRLIVQQLQFNLEQAGFAAINKQTALYKSSLTQAQNLVVQFFKLQDSKTSQFLTQLEQLSLAKLSLDEPLTLSTPHAIEEQL